MRESIKRMTKLIHYTFVLTTEEVMLGRVLVEQGVMRERYKTSIHSTYHRKI